MLLSQPLLISYFLKKSVILLEDVSGVFSFYGHDSILNNRFARHGMTLNTPYLLPAL